MSNRTMRTLLRNAVFLSTIAAFALMAHAQEARGRPDVAAGDRLAAQICDECHVVGGQPDTPSILRGYGPSFFAIANKPDTTAQSLRAFLLHPHAFARMPYPDLTPKQAADVAAYILSLRGRREPF